MKKFNEINLSSETLRAIEDMGFSEMSKIQEDAIPRLLDGKDIIGQSQTGTGKTAAFSIPIIENCDIEENKIQAMVLCPTRELSVQVSEEIKRLGKYKKGLKVMPIYGGESIAKQTKNLKKGVHIVVGTPGRLIDHKNRKNLDLSNIKTIILDEADEMFDMGFRDDMDYILKDLDKNRQTVFFSATMDKKIVKFANRYQKEAETIKVKKSQMTVAKIEQTYYELKEGNKEEILTRVLDFYEPKLAIIFCNTKKQVDRLVDNLLNRGYFADALHGDLRQTQRDKVMKRFRDGSTKILIATDVAARGIDVDDVDVVINYDMPEDEEYYVHRIGRTGRAGREGRAFNFVSRRDNYRLKKIEKYIKAKITKADFPKREDVKMKKMDSIFENIKSVMEDKDLKTYKKILAENTNDLDLENFAAALLKLYMDKDSVVADKPESNAIARLHMNVGRKMGIKPNHILAALMEKADYDSSLVEKIDIFETFSFFEIPESKVEQTIRNMNGTKIRGRMVRIERSKKK